MRRIQTHPHNVHLNISNPLIRYKDLWPEQAPCRDCSPKTSRDQLFSFIFHSLFSMILHDTCRHWFCIPLDHLKGLPPFLSKVTWQKSIKWRRQACTWPQLEILSVFQLRWDLLSAASSCAPHQLGYDFDQYVCHLTLPIPNINTMAVVIHKAFCAYSRMP